MSGTQYARSAGILLHPTSLPGPYGIGDLGPAAWQWIDDLRRAKQAWWQMLPLAPTGFGDSPYQSLSSFAGNTNLISPDALIVDGLLSAGDLPPAEFPTDHVDFEHIKRWKEIVLHRAWDSLSASGHSGLRDEFRTYCEREANWLNDFALFMALKNAHGGGTWLDWPHDLATREPATLQGARRALAGEIGYHEFCQFLFSRQWHSLREYAHRHGIQLIGDLPIFVAADSADCWANRQFFALDEDARPTFVAGVPPDYFAKTGQLWGNPLYDWPALKADGYAWWIARLRKTLEEVDLVRLDHFRGFEAYWEIPGNDATAEHGRWVKGPGADLFHALRNALGQLPLIAEDLGVITREVDELRHQFHLPGMCVLQFAFGGAQEDRFLPHNVLADTVIYTGTHDNDTTRGWFEREMSDADRDRLEQFCPGAKAEPAWTLMRLAWESPATLAIAPLQDVFDLGPEARMNIPGMASGNWQWRFPAELLTGERLDRLAALTSRTGRARGDG